MVLRSWAGYAAVTAADAYPRHLLQTVRPKLAALEGFRGLYLLRHHGQQEVEFRVLTLWESMDSIRAFAGNQPDLAVVEPEAKATLLRYDHKVRHYEILAAP